MNSFLVLSALVSNGVITNHILVIGGMMGRSSYYRADQAHIVSRYDYDSFAIAAAGS